MEQQYAVQPQLQCVPYDSVQQYRAPQPQQQQHAEVQFAAPQQQQYAQCVAPQYAMREALQLQVQ